MKKYISLLLAAVMAMMCLTSCGLIPEKETEPTETASQPDTYESVDDVYVTMQLQEYRDHVIAEIPMFKSDGINPAVDSLNDEIDEKLMSMYREDKRGDALELEEDEDGDATDHNWVDIRTYPVTGERYVQAICTAKVDGYYGYRGENTQGHVYSFVYDRDSKKQVTVRDALKSAGRTEEEIAAEVEDKYHDFYWTEDEEIECTVDGFRIIENESGDEYEFYIYIYVYDTYLEVNFSVLGICSADGEFSIYNGVRLIDPEYLDEMEPTLYYGIN